MAGRKREGAGRPDGSQAARDLPTSTSVLLAARDPSLVVRLRRALSEGGERVRLAGVVDPTIERTLVIWRGEADVLMIGSDELLYLLRRDGEIERELVGWCCLISLTRTQHVLDVVSALGREAGILCCDGDGELPFAAIEATLNGYVVLSGELLQRLIRDQPRLDIVRRLSPKERLVLRCLGEAVPTEAIAARAGLSNSRVKSMITLLIRKLRLRNRTSLAVFAACHRRLGVQR